MVNGSEHRKNTERNVEIQYDRGTLQVFCNGNTDLPARFPWLRWDGRSRCHRCHAYRYHDLIRYLYLGKFGYSDSAPKYQTLELSLNTDFTPFDYQAEALFAWKKSKRGVAVLPTGTGKSFLAAMIARRTERSTLILAPTIDLILQWQRKLEEWFQCPIGLLGGGSSEIHDITVATYDSARIYAENLGNRFCLLVFDECHHLPSPGYAEMARAYIAPYRLGLTATPSIEPERQLMLDDLIGPILYSRQIQQLSGDFLSPYRVETIEVELTADERREYDCHRSIYLEYRDKVPNLFGRRNSWEKFVMYCYRSDEGRRAIRSFAVQKQISLSAEGKMDVMAQILVRHKDSRILIFTNDNKTAYYISSLFLLPLITHETKAKERKSILENFRSGHWPYLVNSRVLNEGVDVPEANVAVIVSGTATVREHVQRLGRILRKQEGKTAILYEIITADTGEIYTSRRRRVHGAYENRS
ncbi:MAG: DEAD/DEAH box helicase [Proteobacteria bacterium]|nr:DEAD/DEAH box helicase [Pseudomonadota bacterium]